MRAAVTVLSLLVAIAGCEAEPRDRTWPAVLSSLPAEGGVVFAPTFSAAPPDGKSLRLSLHASSPAAACSLYRQDFAGDSEIVFLRLETNQYSVGRFEIVEQLDPMGGLQAQVRVIHARGNTKLNTYPATGGYLEVVAVPTSLEEWKRGVSVQAKLHAAFSSDPVVGNHCWHAQSKDGTESSGGCDCTHASGQVTQCVPSLGQQHCCTGSGLQNLSYDADLRAEPCPSLCSYSDPDLAGYCLELE
jgi:hypothetical protein